MKTVGYLRVSTKRQGASGLGLEAQNAAIAAHVTQRSAELVDVFVEVESGGSSDRPELLKALHLAKVTGSTLVIAKLDRLPRNAAFLLALRDSGVRFVAADMPDANDLTVGIMALVAEQERQAISSRTKDALRAAKARGVVLGNPNGAEALRRASKGNAASVEAIKRVADDYARNLRPVVDELRLRGVTGLGSLAAALNGKGIPTPRGARWHKTSVRNLLERQSALGN